MPGGVFFQQLGLFVVPNFLDSEIRFEFCKHIAAAPAEKAVIVGPAGESQLDLHSRKVESSILPKEITAPLKRRLREILPDLEKHFGVSLADCERPQYLMYRAGDFFRAHRDVGSYAMKHFIEQRRVSVVIFLNAQSQKPADGSYGDGQLVFYGLLEGAQWQNCAFPLDAEPGLLIAFPSDKWHEVKPVSHGVRFTIVTWFYGPETETAAEGGTVSATPTTIPL